MGRNGDLDSQPSKRTIELKEENIDYDYDEEHDLYPFRPQVVLNINLKEGSQKSKRPFEAKDMDRVLDYDNVDPPPDGIVMLLEPYGLTDGFDEGKARFPHRHVTVRGRFLFIFDLQDVDGDGPYTLYNNDPIGVLPIDNVKTELPAGGRRMFREHATTNAKSGYEFAVMHVPPEIETKRKSTGGNSPPIEEGAEVEEGKRARIPFFIVANTSGEREKWVHAISSRADIKQTTKLRLDYIRGAAARRTSGAIGGGPGASSADMQGNSASPNKAKLSSADSSHGRKLTGDSQSSKYKRATLESNEDSEILAATNKFGSLNFNEQTHMNTFFTEHNDFDAPARCSQMEHWQASIKKNLKAAVLEQYEYFVQASGEMTTMGTEVSSLRRLVETQVETIKEMKEIDFSSTLLDRNKMNNQNHRDQHHNMNNNHIMNGGVGDDEDSFNHNNLKNGKKSRSALYDDDNSIASSIGGKMSSKSRVGDNESKDVENSSTEDHFIEVPVHLDEVAEVFSALMKECRYSDAIERWNKAKDEISDLFDKHKKPIQMMLSEKGKDRLRNIQRNLDRLVNICASRIEESLRRKNEALKQGSKRERSDPLSVMAPIVSPCCLGDDAIPLQLLVRLGKTHAAANAYSTRRSLLLLESLHEHPISGAGSVDLVIYSAQLSQSFFSCLASSVEGFLDLFVAASQPLVSVSNDSGGATNTLTASVLNIDKSNKGSHTNVSSTIHSTAISKTVPSGAMASIVLWCDSELAKFATAFGGTKILANLALSPPPRNHGRKNRNENSDVNGGASSDISQSNGNRERQNAIEVAAQCVEQAFSCASQNLDSVGLPLTPRLAEYIRSRLKGCEAEVAQLLDNRWYHITLDWRAKFIHNDISMD